MIESIDPSTNEVIARVRQGSIEDYQRIVQSSLKSYQIWSNIPSPKRGEILRQIAQQLRNQKENLGKLVIQSIIDSIFSFYPFISFRFH